MEKTMVNEMVGQPFGGFLGDTIHLKVLAHLIAEPCRQYRIVDVAEETQSNPGTVSKIMRSLENVGFVEALVPGAKHPIYRVNCESNKLMAITILALAIKDDHDGSELMNDTIKHYCHNILENGAMEVGSQTSISHDNDRSKARRTTSSRIPIHIRGGQA